MVQIELEPDLEARVERLAADSEVTTGFLLHAAVERYVEDREDYLAGIRALANKKYVISLDELERRSNVAD